MPLLYGEGRHAWQRLQQELIKTSNDETLFAWREGIPGVEKHSCILSSHPRDFALSSATMIYPIVERLPYGITNQGLEIKLKAASALESQVGLPYPGKLLIISLNCCIRSMGNTLKLCLLVLSQRHSCGHYEMIMCTTIGAIYSEPGASCINFKHGTFSMLETLTECGHKMINVHVSSTDSCTTKVAAALRDERCTTNGIRDALFDALEAKAEQNKTHMANCINPDHNPYLDYSDDDSEGQGSKEMSLR
ncbi:hypothetical protein CLAFUW4_06286 [Fulvia fulva]|uniref:Uncharacterized protein n=1 Tax=Passalora fulva TaxID=5499 RepID=A0A9Q8LI09_PASFU|nr:uncharacterized protein CLAFUR5_06429 [Fulvia fulva]KAK4623648.1 hypothetical protein CLAFUR4_06289 [Fulvia fulva]KAK4624984.1 hypothetical protein CLAFUR0_06293 [Fulvia fulva]UJO17842.1 hypothetical protein CLAFUR5_06429 [Fulvia fulva]WPV14980.1 hypothetical protein CLAFUW4_06286 [Fulvia fulva]WPV29665.1 hypothetical protein CLAFUW7_06282 [Fulvia fulva]